MLYYCGQPLFEGGIDHEMVILWLSIGSFKPSKMVIMLLLVVSVEAELYFCED